MDDAFNTYTQSRYVSHLLPLLKLGRSYSLMEPIISAYSRKAELLPPPNMSSPMVKRTKLIAYVHFAPLKFSASTFALLMPISHPLAVSSLASLSTPIPRTGVRRGVGIIFVGMPCGYGRVKTLRRFCLDLQRRYKHSRHGALQ